MKHQSILFITIGLLSFSLIGCNNNKGPIRTNDISVIYTTDVHCGLDKNLGYSSLYSYKEKLKQTNYVTLVDAGDFLQGDFIGAISNGEYAVEVMNEVQYDIVTLGNHEFDYGMDVLKERIDEFTGEVTSCNFTYIGHHENKFTSVKPYIIKEYGNKKVGYIGVTTPSSLVTSNPKSFIEDDELAYDFGAPTPTDFYNLVQTNIDNCKSDGADYIIMLSHLGSTDSYAPYRSIDVINHTSGAIAFLDGHAHVSLPWTTEKNKDNEDTLLVGTGYKLNNFASITIKEDGSITHEFIDTYTEKSPKIDEVINNIKTKADEQGKKVVANIDVDLKITDEDGLRMVRNRETQIGNVVTDAYRAISEADIGITNGGAIRDELLKGDVTYKDIMNIHPYGNKIMIKKSKGSTILDYLEFTSMKTQHDRVKDGKPLGEFGGFAQVSGLRYTIDTSIPTSVVLDEHNNFVRVDGVRRVKNVQVLVNDTYVDIEENKYYTVASHDFLLENGGDGAVHFQNDETVPSEEMQDYEVLIKYIVKILEGHLKEKYSSIEGRINVL